MDVLDYRFNYCYNLFMKKFDFKKYLPTILIVLEFGDYQCPSCATWSTYIKDSVIAKYGDKILFVFKNFPLPIH